MGGQRAFSRFSDERTIAYADISGNRQYLSAGNLALNDRIALILMDYTARRRLKLWGRACLVEAESDPFLMERLTDLAYPALVERAVVIAIEAIDWNCPQHITRRFTEAELEPLLSLLRNEIENLRAALAGRR